MATGNSINRIGTLGMVVLLAGAAGIACQRGGTLILPGDGTAGVSIGDDTAAVVAALGEPESTTSHGVAGTESSLLEYYLYPARGIDVLLKDGTVVTLFLYNEGSEDHHRFEGRTPEGVTLASTRQNVLDRLGKPDWRSQGDIADLLFDYHRGIEFVFRPDSTIQNIVIKAPVP